MAKARSLDRTFEAFRLRWFRWFWLGRVLSAAGYQTRDVVQSWVVYNLTGSAFVLSWVGSASSAASFLFSLIGGVASDRTDRRRLLVLCQALVGATALGMALLLFAGVIEVWPLALSAFIMAACFAFILPARQALLAELVPRTVLMNAMALATVGMAAIGASASGLGGAMTERSGPAVVYLVSALMLLAAAYLYLQVPRPERREPSTSPFRTDLVEGGRYILRQPTLLAALVLEVGRVIIYMPYVTFLPVFAADVFKTGAIGLGMLKGITAAGGLFGSLAVASLGDIRRKGWLLLAMGLLDGAGLIWLGQATSFPLALISLLVITMAANAYMVVLGTLLQSTCTPRMRGRMEGYVQLIWGLVPLGTLPLGALADTIGVRWTVTLEGALLVAVFLVAALSQPQIRNLR